MATPIYGAPNNPFGIIPGTPASAQNATASSPGALNPYLTMPNPGPNDIFGNASLQLGLQTGMYGPATGPGNLSPNDVFGQASKDIATRLGTPGGTPPTGGAASPFTFQNPTSTAPIVGTQNLNPNLFASPTSAETIARIMGGSVVPVTPLEGGGVSFGGGVGGGPLSMLGIKMPGSDQTYNAGDLAMYLNATGGDLQKALAYLNPAERSKLGYTGVPGTPAAASTTPGGSQAQQPGPVQPAGSPGPMAGTDGGAPNANSGLMGQLMALTLGQGLTPDQALAKIAGTGGMPLNAVDAWTKMVEAQQRQLNRGAADLSAAFDVSGGRFSTDFGTAMTDYRLQATKDQNALLATMQLPLMQQMSNQAFGATGQLSGQDFQSKMLQMQQAFAASQALTNLFGQGGLMAAQQLASQGVTGAQGLFGGQLSGAQAQIAALLGLNNSTVQGGLQSIGAGTNLSALQIQALQDQINRSYQEFLRTQPEYSPLLGLMGSMATGYPPTSTPSYGPSGFSQIAGGVTSMLTALQALTKLIGAP